jgi:purine-nucleoside phosphorylase
MVQTTSARTVRKVDQEPAVVATKLARLSPLRPSLALVLGTGFGRVAQAVEVKAEAGFADLPGFPVPSVSGHAGRILIGRLRGVPVLVLSGRAHFYEGHDLSTVTFPIRVLAALGITDILLTNAAGGISRSLRPGDLMTLHDHINLIGANPLRPRRPVGTVPAFLDLTRVYDLSLRRLLVRAGARCGVRLRAGVYLAVSGPSYETPAEIKAFARLGADAVGMSTVPEAIVARQCGLRVAGLSCITNLAAGRTQRPLSHREVLETGNRVGEQASRLIGIFVELYAQRLFAARPARNQIRIEKPSRRGNVARGTKRQ